VAGFVAVTVGVPVDAQPLSGGFSGMQLARVALADGHEVVVKWAPDGPASKAGLALLREAEALSHLRAHRFDQVAASIATEPGVPALVMQAVPGGPASAWDSGTLAAAARVLDDLAGVPAHGLRPLPATDVAKPRPLLAQRVRDALPDEPDLAEELLQAYWAVSAGPVLDRDGTPLWWGRPAAATHGDPHPGNWMVDDDGRLRLIDLEHLCAGPPGWDLAYLCSHLPGPADERAHVLAGSGLDVVEAARLVAAATALLVAGTRSPDPVWAARQRALAPAGLELVRRLR
jgi:aminoglycoside phosphotransferase (APT) family kinase protein